LNPISPQFSTPEPGHVSAMSASSLISAIVTAHPRSENQQVRGTLRAPDMRRY
jgi:hypothetical protein